MFSIGLAGFALLAAMVVATAGRRTRRWAMGLLVAKLGLFAVWISSHDDFVYVIYDYTPTLIVILAIQIYVGLKRKNKSAPWIVAGVLVSFAAAGIQMSGLALHRHFNHNDIYHVVQIAGMALFYRGGCLLRDR
jgi:peptidoglycan/LPS O-acetylase OafA/YrhL